MTIKRSVRVSERIQHELASMLRDLRDPRLTGAIISRVEMPDDLQMARVFVRTTSGIAETHQKRELLKGFSAASGRLRREVAKRLSLRYAPDLRFFYDDGPDASARIEELLREIQNES